MPRNQILLLPHLEDEEYLNVLDEYEQGEVMAVAESVKAASDIYAPIKGKITAVNEKLEESPELVNESPYGSGWMVQMEPSGEMPALIDAESYKNSLD